LLRIIESTNPYSVVQPFAHRVEQLLAFSEWISDETGHAVIGMHFGFDIARIVVTNPLPHTSIVLPALAQLPQFGV
jgi:hypothetical protein